MQSPQFCLAQLPIPLLIRLILISMDVALVIGYVMLCLCSSVLVNGIEISSFHVQIGPIMINIQTDRKVLHCLFDMFDVILRTQDISDGIYCVTNHVYW